MIDSHIQETVADGTTRPIFEPILDFVVEHWDICTVLMENNAASHFSEYLYQLIVRPFHSQRIAHVVAGGALLAEGLKSHCVVRLTVRIMKRKPSQDGVISNHSVKIKK